MSQQPETTPLDSHESATNANSDANTGEQQELLTSREDTNTTASDALQTSKHARTPIGLWVLSFFNMLLVITAAIAGYYIGYPLLTERLNQLESLRTTQQSQATQLAQTQSEWEQVNRDLQLATTQQKNTQSTMQALAAQVEQEVSMQAVANTNIEQQVADLAEKMTQIAPSQVEAAKAFFAVQQQQLAGALEIAWYVEQDRRKTVQLLQLLANTLTNSSVDEVRLKRAINADLVELESLVTRDTEQLWLTADSIGQRINELRLVTAESPLPEMTVSLTNDIQDWKSNIATSWQTIRDALFKVENLEAVPAIPLSKEQERLLKARADVLIEQLKIAILRQQPWLYEAVLDDLTQLITTHFDRSERVVFVIEQQIEKLKNLRFSSREDYDLKTSDVLKRTTLIRLNSSSAAGATEGATEGAMNQEGSNR